MAKQVKTNDEDENLTVSKVYDIVKSGPFLKNLYWDVLSGIKDKVTHKNMTEIIEKIVNKKSDVLATLSDSEPDDVLRKKTIVAEICSMTYAVDTIFSKILFMKLEKVFKSEICNILKDLRNEGKIPDDIWAELPTSNIFKAEDSDEKTGILNESARHQGEMSTQSDPVPEKGKRKGILSTESDKNSDHHKGKNIAESGNKSPKKTIGDKKKDIPKKRSCISFSSTPKREIKTEDVSTKLNALKDGKEDSDAESEISYGNISIASVSPVHTSELSSYDDEISLSSEDDDGNKKRLSLNYLQQLCQNGNFNSSIEKKCNGTKSTLQRDKVSSVEGPDSSTELQKLCQNGNFNSRIEKKYNGTKLKLKRDKISFVEGPDSSTEFPPSQSSTSMTASKRVRKPNSKYSSENIVCHSVKVKERKKRSAADTKSSSDENSPKKKRARDESSDSDAKIDVENYDTKTPSTVQKIVINKEEKNTTSDAKIASKQRELPGSFKHHSTFRSLTSRRTAPITLFSTAP